MKRFILILILLALTLAGCAAQPSADIAATTAPVYQFTYALCEGTGLAVTQLVTENISCLHEYSLSVRQVKAVESAGLVVLSGGGLEDFMADVLEGKQCIDSSEGISMLESCHSHGHGHDDHSHEHEHDPHFWLSPESAKQMAQNICEGLKAQFPAHADTFSKNLQTLSRKFDDLQAYGQQQLAELSCRELITFHDGFSYFAHSFGLEILRAVEEESGSEASASELKELIGLVQEHSLSAIFTEVNGSVSAAGIIAAETGAGIFRLSMAMGDTDYFEAMYQNIDTLREALG